jgi:transposase
VREANAASSQLRVGPSSGVPRSHGILRRASRPRRHKHEHRLRGSRSAPSERRPLPFVGIDIASERHVVAVVSEQGDVVVKATGFSEDASGYQALRVLLGAPDQTVIALEATGHDWQNLVAYLAPAGLEVALLNPRRTHHCAGEELQRPKTAAIDALGMARFAAQKRPPATRLPDAVTPERRALVRLRDRLSQECGDRLRQLHRVVDRVSAVIQ